MAGIWRNSFAMGVIGMSLAVAPCILAEHGPSLLWNVDWCRRGQSKFVTTALTPVSITALGSPTSSVESRVVSRGGHIAGVDLLWAMIVSSESISCAVAKSDSVGSSWTSTKLERPTKIFDVTSIGLRLMMESVSQSRSVSEAAKAVTIESKHVCADF